MNKRIEQLKKDIENLKRKPKTDNKFKETMKRSKKELANDVMTHKVLLESKEARIKMLQEDFNEYKETGKTETGILIGEGFKLSMVNGELMSFAVN